MKKLKTCTLALLAALPLFSCGESKETESALDQEEIATLKEFQKGFTISGTLSSVKKYFNDEGYNVPADDKEDLKNDYSFKLVYENSDNYTGVDRRYYRLKDGKERYISGENVYNNNGYVGINYIDYSNKLQTDGYSSSDDFNEEPYASSGFVNPFLLLKKEDFKKDDNYIYLSNTKTNILYGNIFAGISKYVNLHIPLERGRFSKDWSTLTVDSLDFKALEATSGTSYYTETHYSLEFNFAEIGEASAKNAIKPEPTKQENAPLATALKNMAGKKMAITRHSITYDGEEKIEDEETVTTYNDGSNIYMQVYYYNLFPEGPDAPTASDVYLKTGTDGLLDAYVYSEKNEDGSYQFARDNGTYGTLEDYDYSTFQPYLSINSNIFNKNEDGSFSPTDDNLPYIGGDCFVPPLNTTTEIANGFVTSMKIYLSSDQKYIDEIIFEFDEAIYTGYTGKIIINYSQIGTCSVPFNIVL